MFIRFSKVIKFCTLLCVGLYIFSIQLRYYVKCILYDIIWYTYILVDYSLLTSQHWEPVQEDYLFSWSLGKNEANHSESSHFDDKGHLALGIHLQHFEEIYSKGYFWWTFHLLCFHPLFPSFPIMSLFSLHTGRTSITNLSHRSYINH